MNSNCQANPCPVLVNASCVFYEGPNLICIGVNTNDTIEKALMKINALICNVYGLDGTSGTNGTSGTSGAQGPSGTSGINGGTNGTSGTRGSNGTSGTNGSTGSSGTNGINGSSGSSGTSGTGGGGGGSSCPDHTKIAGMSGQFISDSLNVPSINKISIGNEDYGWGYGNYTVGNATTDGFGNLISFPSEYISCGIPIPVDLNVGDVVKLCGIASISLNSAPTNPAFYISLSYFTCNDIQSTIPVSTIISPVKYAMNVNLGKVCFSQVHTLTEILPACTTFFVVGMVGANDDQSNIPFKFSYTLDVTQACIATGNNLFIRNCCDPAYSEIIINNLVPVGSSFVDNDGNCWNVVSETDSSVTSTRTKSAQYTDCTACIAANPCPPNFRMVSCCTIGEEVFSAALPGVNVGDTFVDTNGYCWSASSISSLPITNVIAVSTVYSGQNCASLICVETNPCPTSVILTSCCTLGEGQTTLEILQATLPSLVIGDTFVDTFGFCWTIATSDRDVFPSLSFIIPDVKAIYENCTGCLTSNPCSESLYYTIQNCCSEEIEVVLTRAGYLVNDVLLAELTTGAGCYRVLSWSDVGTATSVVDFVSGVSRDCTNCSKALETKYGVAYCQGIAQCCTTYVYTGLEAFITGYTCDGEWLYNYIPSLGENLCMALVVKFTNFERVGPCCFDIYNPSSTSNMVVTSYTACNNCTSQPTPINIAPGQSWTNTVGFGCCLSCVEISDRNGKYEYQPCNP